MKTYPVIQGASTQSTHVNLSTTGTSVQDPVQLLSTEPELSNKVNSEKKEMPSSSTK